MLRQIQPLEKPLLRRQATDGEQFDDPSNTRLHPPTAAHNNRTSVSSNNSNPLKMTYSWKLRRSEAALTSSSTPAANNRVGDFTSSSIQATSKNTIQSRPMTIMNISSFASVIGETGGGDGKENESSPKAPPRKRPKSSEMNHLVVSGQLHGNFVVHHTTQDNTERDGTIPKMNIENNDYRHPPRNSTSIITMTEEEGYSASNIDEDKSTATPKTTKNSRKISFASQLVTTFSGGEGKRNSKKRRKSKIKLPFETSFKFPDLGRGRGSGVSKEKDNSGGGDGGGILPIGADGNSSNGKSKWEIVRKNIPKIIELGVEEGILPPRKQKRSQNRRSSRSHSLFGSKWGGGGDDAGESVLEDEEDSSKKTEDEIHFDINDLSLIHEAIPFLPVPVAALCLFLNIVLPGVGTALSGVIGMCMGQPRIQMKDGRRISTLLINIGVGLSQMMTITFFLVGWCWSIAWGGLLIIHSIQYRNALMQRRQEAVATAAIEALTKDSVLHRKDLKNLIGQGKETEKQRKKSSAGEGDEESAIQ